MKPKQQTESCHISPCSRGELQGRVCSSFSRDPLSKNAGHRSFKSIFWLQIIENKKIYIHTWEKQGQTRETNMEVIRNTNKRVSVWGNLNSKPWFWTAFVWQFSKTNPPTPTWHLGNISELTACGAFRFVWNVYTQTFNEPPQITARGRLLLFAWVKRWVYFGSRQTLAAFFFFNSLEKRDPGKEGKPGEVSVW